MKIYAVAFSTNGCRTALRLRDALPEDEVTLFCKTTSDTLGIQRIEGTTKEWTGKAFEVCDAIVYIGALGIAVRYIAPFIRSKDVDPAVVCMDEHAHHTIALLSGHIGGCNNLTERIASRMDSEAVITTATDINGKFSVDSFAVANDLRIMGLKIAKDVSARVLDGRFVGFTSDIPVEGDLPDGLTMADRGEFGVSISTDVSKEPFDRTMRLVPMDIAIGVGCKRDTDPGKLHDYIYRILEEDGIAPERVRVVSSIDLKQDERAVLDLATSLKVPARFHSAEELNSLEGDFSQSKFVTSVTTVDCVCERSAVIEGGVLTRRKTAEDGMTVAIGRIEMKPRFV